MNVQELMIQILTRQLKQAEMGTDILLEDNARLAFELHEMTEQSQAAEVELLNYKLLELEDE